MYLFFPPAWNSMKLGSYVTYSFPGCLPSGTISWCSDWSAKGRVEKENVHFLWGGRERPHERDDTWQEEEQMYISAEGTSWDRELGGTWRTTIGGFPSFVAFTKGRTSMNLGSKSQVRVRSLVRLREDGAAKIDENSLGRCVGSRENQLTLSTRKVGTQSIQVLNSCLMPNSCQMLRHIGCLLQYSWLVVPLIVPLSPLKLSGIKYMGWPYNCDKFLWNLDHAFQL